MNVSERSSHPTAVQIEVLIGFMEKNPQLAKGFLKTQSARTRSKRLWEEITVHLNSMGGTIKNYKQWTKYWSDKKCSVRKKVAAIAAARRKTGGEVEDEELSEVEQKIVALCGGKVFGTGDSHLGVPLTGPESLPSQPQIKIEMVDVNEHSPSQDIIHDYHQDPFLSPSPPTLSHTPSPMSTTSSPHHNMVLASQGAAAGSSSYSREAQPPSPSQHSATPFEASPYHRRTTTNNSRHIPYTRRDAASSLRSRRQVPPSQRRTEFSSVTQSLLWIEEQLVEIQRSNARMLQTVMEHSISRDRALTDAVTAMGEGLKALAEAIKN